MMKLIKVFKKIIRYFLAYLNALYYIIQPKKNTTKPVAFVFHVAKWKHSIIRDYLKDYEVRYIPFNSKLGLIKYEIKKYSHKVFIFWGKSESKELVKYALDNNISIYRLEDGFVRSKGLGSLHNLPYSICLDKTGIYFDSTTNSDLENILNTYNFNEDKELIKRSKKIIEMLLDYGLSKYNHVNHKDINDIYGPKKSKRILVIGQVEDDASIIWGSNKPWTNNELVKIARSENPDAEIFYKPHPDVLAGKRFMKSNPKDVKDLATIVVEPLSLNDAFKTIDHVYTITSLSGFEALLRGIKVTTLGAPFYSNWGLTDDRQMVTRRLKKLSIEELFAGAYLLYPQYINPETRNSITLEEVLEKLK